MNQLLPCAEETVNTAMQKTFTVGDLQLQPMKQFSATMMSEKTVARFNAFSRKESEYDFG